MTDTEIKAEAEKRLLSMTKEEKLNFIGVTDSDRELMIKARLEGIEGLSNGELSVLNYWISRETRFCSGMGTEYAELEKMLKNRFSIRRDDLKDPNIKNPFKTRIILSGVIAAVLLIFALFFAFSDATFAAFLVLFMLWIAAVIVVIQSISRYRQFNKLHAKHVNGELEEDEIKAEMTKMIFQEGLI
jgi:hypothetical protein